jgi:hypothetical protein
MGLGLLRRNRLRSYKTHVAQDYVDQLREFIQIRTAQEFPEKFDPGSIVAPEGAPAGRGMSIVSGRAEHIPPKLPATQPNGSLGANNRAAQHQSHEQARGDQDWCQKRQRNDGDRDIKGALGKSA